MTEDIQSINELIKICWIKFNLINGMKFQLAKTINSEC